MVPGEYGKDNLMHNKQGNIQQRIKKSNIILTQRVTPWGHISFS